MADKSDSCETSGTRDLVSKIPGYLVMPHITMSDPEVVYDARDIESNKVMAILAYIWLLFLVPLLAAKDSKFAQFHAHQGMSLFITWVIVNVIGWILPYTLSGLTTIATLGVLVLAIIGIMNAYQGKAKPLPLIGKFLTPKS
jgi:uncharacterized membrane protein